MSLSQRYHTKRLKLMCDQLHQTYLDKIPLDNYLYSFQITLNDEKNAGHFRRENNIGVKISIISVFNSKTKVKDFESMFYKESKTFLGSTFLRGWIDMLIGSNYETYHSGPIVLDNSQGNIVMINISVPKKNLEIQSMTIRSILEVNSILYYLLKLMPVIVILISFTISLNISIFMAFLIAIVMVKCLQKDSKLKDEDSNPSAITPTAESARLPQNYYDID